MVEWIIDNQALIRRQRHYGVGSHHFPLFKNVFAAYGNGNGDFIVIEFPLYNGIYVIRGFATVRDMVHVYTQTSGVEVGIYFRGQDDGIYYADSRAKEGGVHFRPLNVYVSSESGERIDDDVVYLGNFVYYAGLFVLFRHFDVGKKYSARAEQNENDYNAYSKPDVYHRFFIKSGDFSKENFKFIKADLQRFHKNIIYFLRYYVNIARVLNLLNVFDFIYSVWYNYYTL